MSDQRTTTTTTRHTYGWQPFWDDLELFLAITLAPYLIGWFLGLWR